MKTFSDLVFEPHKTGDGLHAVMLFPNGYGVSVVRFNMFLFGSYGSYTRNESEWELAVLEGTEKDWSLCYTTPVTDDVIGYLDAQGVTDIMKQVQELKQREVRNEN